MSKQYKTRCTPTNRKISYLYHTKKSIKSKKQEKVIGCFLFFILLESINTHLIR